ncbi:MAG: Na+-transporting NADH:ubiquinone oxidoreductase subunit D [Bacteroidetes bacterium]|nr:MAG: Na+-transporting NADH:ubiquinone oxidoreductase subunit D [Bacteroidota bacterium]
MGLLTVSGSPHIHGGLSVRKMMWGVVIAMIPAMLASFYYFGLGAIKVTLVAVASAMLFEYLIARFIMKQKPDILDGSAVITGILLAFNVPSNLPIWIIIIGSLIAIGVAKMSFGGLGKNPFNPALVGRVFLLISFPAQMTSFPVVEKGFPMALDAVTGATPLGIVKEGLKNGDKMADLMHQIPDYTQLFFGQTGGSLGEVSAFLLLLGGIYMLIRKIITWQIPVSFLGSVVIFSGILWLINPEQYVNPLFHLLTGGIMLGVFFMATDMVTSPMTGKAQLIFGAGVGILTIIIRVWGAYPEGVSFAILLMNAVVPHLNNAFKPKRFGKEVKHV